MRLGTSIDTTSRSSVIAATRDAKAAGFSTVWSSQIFGVDALTVLAVVAREVDGIEVGTAVVPVHARHAQMLAQQALTCRPSRRAPHLGIGLSHKVVVETCGAQLRLPGDVHARVRHAIVPDAARRDGERAGRARLGDDDGSCRPPVDAAPRLLLAALGPKMLQPAGGVADGTATWMTGIATLRDYVVPTIRAAVGRGRPR